MWVVLRALNAGVCFVMISDYLKTDWFVSDQLSRPRIWECKDYEGAVGWRKIYVRDSPGAHVWIEAVYVYGPAFDEEGDCYYDVALCLALNEKLADDFLKAEGYRVHAVELRVAHNALPLGTQFEKLDKILQIYTQSSSPNAVVTYAREVRVKVNSVNRFVLASYERRGGGYKYIEFDSFDLPELSCEVPPDFTAGFIVSCGQCVLVVFPDIENGEVRVYDETGKLLIDSWEFRGGAGWGAWFELPCDGYYDRGVVVEVTDADRGGTTRKKLDNMYANVRYPGSGRYEPEVLVQYDPTPLYPCRYRVIVKVLKGESPDLVVVKGEVDNANLFGGSKEYRAEFEVVGQYPLSNGENELVLYLYGPGVYTVYYEHAPACRHAIPVNLPCIKVIGDFKNIIYHSSFRESDRRESGSETGRDDVQRPGVLAGERLDRPDWQTNIVDSRPFALVSNQWPSVRSEPLDEIQLKRILSS